MALLRDVQNLCPKDVLNFILDLIKYNDNRKNKVKKQKKTPGHLSFSFNIIDCSQCCSTGSEWTPNASFPATPPPAPPPSFQTTTTART